MNSYDTCCAAEGGLLEFQSRVRTQLAQLLSVSEKVFTIIRARNGSILLDVEMSSPDPQMSDKVKQAHKELVSMLKNGSLVLTDLNGTKLDIPPQANGVLLSSEEKSYTTIIISVTAASLGTTLLLILWILWNNKNNKAINPLGNHLDHLNNHSQFKAKLPIDNLISCTQGIRGNPNNDFATLTDPQVQWEFFQKSFNKPGYVWHSQDEAVWAGVNHQVQWPQLLDVPDEESIPITNRNNADKESKRI